MDTFTYRTTSLYKELIMKKRVFIAAALAGVLYLQGDFIWAANPLQPDQENIRIADQQKNPDSQSAHNQKRTENEARVGVANTGKVQGPAPVILRIRLVDKTAN